MLFFRINSVLKDEFSSVCFLTFLFSLNILVAVGFVKVTILQLQSILLPKLYTIVITCLIGIVLYFLLLYKSRYISDFNDYKASILSSRVGRIYTSIYIILTIFFLIILTLI